MKSWIRDVRVHAETVRFTTSARSGWKCVEKDVDVARCTVDRLMGALGFEGVRRGKKKRTSIADLRGRRADDLVQRRFNSIAAQESRMVKDAWRAKLGSADRYLSFLMEQGYTLAAVEEIITGQLTFDEVSID